MELIIPLVLSIGAFILLILAMVFGYIYNSEELYFFCMIFSTIMFFIGGATWLGVTHIDPVTGASVADTGYTFMVWLMIILGFIPIAIMYESATQSSEN